MRNGKVLRRIVVTVLCVVGSLVIGQSQMTAAKASSTRAAVTFSADDGVVIHGIYTPASSAKALILLFHQAGSSKGEYATIAPRLVAEGYASLAIDQRAGGSLFGTNQTAAALNGDASYLDAKRDLVAALAWAADKHLPVILWGSSYSASLVFLVAADNPGKVAAVMAFSPGEYLGSGSTVRNAAARVYVPIFVTSAQDSGEIAAARSILGAAPSPTKVQFVPTHGGVHGSSTLITARNHAGAAAAWVAVLNFLHVAVP